MLRKFMFGPFVLGLESLDAELTICEGTDVGLEVRVNVTPVTTLVVVMGFVARNLRP